MAIIAIPMSIKLRFIFVLSSNFSVNELENVLLNGGGYNFSIDCSPITAVTNIINSHESLLKKI